MQVLHDSYRSLNQLGETIAALQAVDPEVTSALEAWRARTERRLQARIAGSARRLSIPMPHPRPYLLAELRENHRACVRFIEDLARFYGVALDPVGPETTPERDPALLSLTAVVEQLADSASPDVAGYVEEAVDSFAAGAYRAAVVLSWIGAVSVLHGIVVKHHLDDFNREASKRQGNWRGAKNRQDLSRMNESRFLQILVSLSVLSKPVHKELAQCLSLRNSCGHPSDLRLSRNRVASHIETLVLNVYSKDS